MIIYKITHKETKKSYIGQTRGEVEKRWKEHCSKAGGKSYIGAAIQKYGKDAFDFEIIHRCKVLKDLDRAEAYFIKKHNTYYPRGFNLTKGNYIKLEGPLNKGFYEKKLEEVDNDPDLNRLDKIALKSAISIYKSGRSLRSIVDNFNKLDMRTSKGMAWSIKKIKDLAKEYGLDLK
jgi:group I intron endonuclease